MERKRILVSGYYNCELSGDFRRRGRGDCGIQGKLKSSGDNRNTETDGTAPTTKEGTGQGDSLERGVRKTQVHLVSIGIPINLRTGTTFGLI